ncbi:hypothetical protein ACFYOK_07840 [Microbispora bryophytorum]|uniref:hypothetical protein n=1 Tax=Microbispora bryophytorum TaxID=1460882 RepID=UPI0033CBD073
MRLLLRLRLRWKPLGGLSRGAIALAGVAPLLTGITLLARVPLPARIPGRLALPGWSGSRSGRARLRLPPGLRVRRARVSLTRLRLTRVSLTRLTRLGLARLRLARLGLTRLAVRRRRAGGARTPRRALAGRSVRRRRLRARPGLLTPLPLATRLPVRRLSRCRLTIGLLTIGLRNRHRLAVRRLTGRGLAIGRLTGRGLAIGRLTVSQPSGCGLVGCGLAPASGVTRLSLAEVGLSLSAVGRPARTVGVVRRGRCGNCG